jgi:serine/threonine-protein kinase
LEPGYRLDRYELLCKIGQGGMASVWLARTQGKHGFERLVALKTVLPEHAADPSFRTMLLDEARIAAAIDHPNVARILDVGEERDVPFMVLEYVAGDSLTRMQRKLKAAGRDIPLSIVLRLVADACSGLHAAHELRGADGALLGIVHRDVSPQNILVNELGHVKLIDFGVAKATGRLAAETATGIMKGKVPYMAPEQALGVPVDRRADIWSMGAVAFFLLAGACPFDAANDAARIIRAVTGEAPDPLPPSVPPAVASVVLRALTREAKGRFATAAEMRDALEGAAKRTGSTATSEDVARFFSESLADSAAARKKMLERAMEASGERSRVRELLTYEPSTGSGSVPVLPSMRGAPQGMPMAYGSSPNMPTAPGSSPNMPTAPGSSPGMATPYGSSPGMATPYGSSPGMAPPYGSSPGMAPGSRGSFPHLVDEPEDASAGTIARAVEVQSPLSARPRRRGAVVAASAVALLLAGAIAVGSFVYKARVSGASAASGGGASGAPGAPPPAEVLSPTITPVTPVTPATGVSSVVASAAPEGAAPAPSQAPSASSHAVPGKPSQAQRPASSTNRPATPPLKPKKPDDVTIF